MLIIQSKIAHSSCGNDMSFPFTSSSSKKNEDFPPREGDPLLPSTSAAAAALSAITAPTGLSEPHSSGRRSGAQNLRVRRTSKSPPVGPPVTDQMMQQNPFFEENADPETGTSRPGGRHGYQEIVEDASGSVNTRQSTRSASLGGDADNSSGRYALKSSSLGSGTGDTDEQQAGGRRPDSPEWGYRPSSPAGSRSEGSASQPPLLEIPEEIYAVRKAALKVLKPLTKTWVSQSEQVISAAFSDLIGLFSIDVADCHFGWLCVIGSVWNGSLDSLTPWDTVLVYFDALLVRPHWIAMASCAIRESAIYLYCRSK